MLSLQAAYRHENLQFRIAAENDWPMELQMPDTSSEFQYKNTSLEFVLDYHYGNNALFGMTYRGWNTDKSLAEIVENRSQTLNHHIFDFYWLRTVRKNDEFAIGTRFDRFNNNLRDLNNANQDYDYRIDTWQVYGLLNHEYSIHAGWGIGVYIGRVEESKDYLENPADNKPARETQGKLRTSWEYRSLDNKDRLSLHFTFNLDDLLADPGDGAGISYQSQF
jgi:hypothetical protein